MTQEQVSPEVLSRPILFSAPMVRAILEGRKTQTRRVIKHGFEYDYDEGWPMAEHDSHWYRARCPYGKPGDALWVRETWAHVRDYDGIDPGVAALASGAFYRADHPTGVWSEKDPAKSIRWRPSIHMPRWASRITLGVMSVRVQRLHDISERDCCAEGCGSPITRDWKKPKFRELWESINGAGSWDVNPWVWAVEFERIGMRAAA